MYLPKAALSSVASSSTNASQSKPGIIAVAIQVTIIYFTGISQPGSIVIGCVFNLLGLSLMIWTTRLFITVGKGTLVPWNPPEKLVVLGVYRYVRNPLITGVSCVLLGEAVFFGSLWLLGWVGVFVAANMIYIPLGEEPGLARCFGDDYRHYKQNVPSWIPRWRPWKGLSEDSTAREN